MIIYIQQSIENIQCMHIYIYYNNGCTCISQNVFSLKLITNNIMEKEVWAILEMIHVCSIYRRESSPRS